MTLTAEIIALHREEILALWASEAGHADYARGLSPAELVGGISAYLDSLGGAMAAADPVLSREQEAILHGHLAQRIRQGAELSQILDELIALARCVTQLAVGHDASSGLTPDEVAALTIEVRLTLAASTRIFDEQVLGDEQRGKVVLERLRSAGEAAECRMAPGPLLEGMLHIVREALGADSAAFVTDRSLAGSARAMTFAGEGGQELVRALASHEVHWLSPPGLVAELSAGRGRLGVRSALPRNWTAGDARLLETMAEAVMANLLLRIHADDARTLLASLGDQLARAAGAVREAAHLGGPGQRAVARRGLGQLEMRVAALRSLVARSGAADG